MDAEAFSSLCHRHSIATFFLICVCQAFFWGTLEKWNDGYDVLSQPLVSGEYASIDGWSAIHVLCFMGCAFVSPGGMTTFMLFGVLWELYEFVLSGGSSFWSERGVNTMWDLWFNLAGYRIGEILLVRWGVPFVRKLGLWLFTLGMVLTIVVALTCVWRGELSLSPLDILLLGGFVWLIGKAQQSLAKPDPTKK